MGADLDGALLAPGTIESGAFEPAGGVPGAVFGLAGADMERDTPRAAGGGAGAVASKPPDWSERMVTVWIFFGSDETTAGADTGGFCTGAATDAGGGLFGSDAAGETTGTGDTAPVATGAAIPGDAEFCPTMIGMVETTRGSGRGGSIVTGCSSRETTVSAAPVLAEPTWFELLACNS